MEEDHRSRGSARKGGGAAAADLTPQLMGDQQQQVSPLPLKRRRRQQQQQQQQRRSSATRSSRSASVSSASSDDSYWSSSASSSSSSSSYASRASLRVASSPSSSWSSVTARNERDEGDDEDVGDRVKGSDARRVERCAGGGQGSRVDHEQDHHRGPEANRQRRRSEDGRSADGRERAMATGHGPVIDLGTPNDGRRRSKFTRDAGAAERDVERPEDEAVAGDEAHVAAVAAVAVRAKEPPHARDKDDETSTQAEGREHCSRSSPKAQSGGRRRRQERRQGVDADDDEDTCPYAYDARRDAARGCVDCKLEQRQQRSRGSRCLCDGQRSSWRTHMWTPPTAPAANAGEVVSLWATYRVYAVAPDEADSRIKDQHRRPKKRRRRGHEGVADDDDADELVDSWTVPLGTPHALRSLRRAADRVRYDPIVLAYRALLRRLTCAPAPDVDDGAWLVNGDTELCTVERPSDHRRDWRLWTFRLRFHSPDTASSGDDHQFPTLRMIRSGSFELADVRTMLTSGAASSDATPSTPLTSLESIFLSAQSPLFDEPWRMLARSVDRAQAVRTGDLGAGRGDFEPILSVTSDADASLTISLQSSSLESPSPPTFIMPGVPVRLWPLNLPATVVQALVPDAVELLFREATELALDAMPVDLPESTRWAICWVSETRRDRSRGNLVVWPQHLLSRDAHRTTSQQASTALSVDAPDATPSLALPPTPPLTPLPDSPIVSSQAATDDDVDLGPLLGASPSTVGPVAHDSVDAVSSKLTSPHPLGGGERADSAIGADDWESLTGERGVQHAQGLGVTDDDFDFFDAPHGPGSSRLETIEEREEYAALCGSPEMTAETPVPSEVADFKQEKLHASVEEEEPLPVYEERASITSAMVPTQVDATREAASEPEVLETAPDIELLPPTDSLALVRRRRMHAALACIQRDVTFVRKLGDGRVKDRKLQRQSLRRLARFLAIQAEILEEDGDQGVEIETCSDVHLPQMRIRSDLTSSASLADATVLLVRQRWRGRVQFADVRSRYNILPAKRKSTSAPDEEPPAITPDEAFQILSRPCKRHSSAPLTATAMIRAGHSGLVMELSSAAIAHWQTLGLQPLSGRKIVTTGLLYDALAVDSSLANDWHDDLARTWMSSGFGELRKQDDPAKAALLFVIGNPNDESANALHAIRQHSERSLVVIERIPLSSLRDRRDLSSLTLRLYDRIPLEVKAPRSRFLADQPTRPKRYLPAPAFVLAVPPPVPTRSWTLSDRFITRDEIRTCHVAYSLSDQEDSSGQLCAFVVDATGEAWVADRWSCDPSSPASLKDALGKLFWLMVAFCRAAQLDWRVFIARYGLPSSGEIEAFHGVLAEHKRVMIDFPTDIALFCSVRTHESPSTRRERRQPLRLADGRYLVPLSTITRQQGLDHHLLFGASSSLSSSQQGKNGIAIRELSDDFERLQVLGGHRWNMKTDGCGLPCHLDAVRRMAFVTRWTDAGKAS